MSVTKRKTKFGYVYDVRYRADGKLSKHSCKTFNRKADATEFLERKRTELMSDRQGSGLQGHFDDTTLAQEAEFWLEQMQVELSKGWHQRAAVIIRKNLIPKYGHLSPDRFTIAYVRRMQAEVKLVNRKSEGLLSNSSVNRVTEVLCAVLNYSAKTRRIPYNPLTGYSKLPDDRAEMSYWEEAEVRDFLKFLSSKFPVGHEERWVYVAILVAVNCAIRAGELWGLKPGDVAEETLYIKRQWIEMEKRFHLPKGKRNRKVKTKVPYRHTVLHESVRRELLAIIRQREVKADQTIFYGEDGRPRGHRSFAHRFDRLVKAWGGKRIRFHDLRHTAITLWLHSGVNIRVIQEMAGHENILTTMGYVHMVGGSVSRVSQFHVVSESEPELKLLTSAE